MLFVRVLKRIAIQLFDQKYIPYFLLTYFLLGHIYTVKIGNNWLHFHQLRFLLIGYLCFLLIINTTFKKNALVFSVMAWIILHIISYINGLTTEYWLLHRAGQAIFILSVINYFQVNENLKNFMIFVNKKKNIVAMMLFVTCAAALLNNNFLENLRTGLGGNRVNLSLYLGQLCALLLWAENFSTRVEKRSVKDNFASIAGLLLILTLQVIIGGRLGIFLSLIAFVIFNESRGIYKFYFSMALVSYVVIAGWTVDMLAPGSTLTFNRIMVSENVTPLLSDMRFSFVNNEIFRTFDQITSGRMTIAIAALTALEWDIILHGIGVGQFIVEAFDGYFQPHNVWLNVLGELGVIGLLLFSIISTFVFFRPHFLLKNNPPAFYLLTALFISNFQPDYLFTQVTTCLLYFMLLGYQSRASNIA